MFDAVAPIKMKSGVKKVYRNRFVFGSSEKQLENRVVVDIDILEAFIVFGYASGHVAPLLVGIAYILEHACVLFLVHKGSFAT